MKSVYTVLARFIFDRLVLAFLIGSVGLSPAAYSQTVDCQGTISSWKYDRNYAEYAKGCTCANGPNRMPVCSGGSSAKSGSGGYHPDGLGMQGMMMQAIMAPMLGNLFAPPSAPSGPSAEELKQQEIARQQAEAARIAAEKAKKAALDSWVKAQSDEELRRQAEQEGKIKRGEQLHAQMQALGGNKLEPFSFGSPKLEMAPVSGGSFPTATLPVYDRLMCSAFFSNMARQAKSAVDARFYADQAQLVMNGQPTHIDCKIPKQSSEKMAERSKALKTTYEAVSLKFKDLEGLQIKLDEARQTLASAESKKEQAAAVLADTEKRAAAVPPEQKEEFDDLTARAMKELAEAEKELGEAKSSEQAVNDKMGKLEGEIMQMRSSMQDNRQGN